MDLANGTVHEIADAEGTTVWGFAVSPDGRWVVYQEIEKDSDIMLVENLR